MDIEDILRISLKTIEWAKSLVQNVETDLVFDDIHQHFTLQLLNGFTPGNMNEVLIDFVKRR